VLVNKGRQNTGCSDRPTSLRQRTAYVMHVTLMDARMSRRREAWWC